MPVFSDKKTIFAVLVLILVIVAVGAWFSWGRGTEPEKENVSTPTGGFIVSVPDKPFFGKTVTSLPAFITEESEKTPQKDDFSAFFEESAKQIFVSIEELKKQFLLPVSENPILSPSPTPHVTNSVSAFFMSDEEYFQKFYPPTYIKYLNDLQDWMLKEGYISGKMTFKTEADTYVLFNKLLDFLVQRGYMEKEDGNRFKEGVNATLKDLNKFERPYMEKRLRSVSAVGNIFKQLVAVLTPKVCAQSVTYGDCYTMGIPEPGGYNAWSFCCNCGLWCGYGCTFVYDCGPEGVFCNSGWYGCLNGICYYMPAIWDIMGGICGCG